MTEGSLQDRRILVVEDDAYSLAIMSAILRREGATVFFERWGDDIELRLDKLSPLDLILLDLNLPTTHGYDVYKVIRSVEATMEVPVVVVSASGDTSVVNEVRERGFNGFIAKPIKSGDFAGHMQKAIAGEEVWVRR